MDDSFPKEILKISDGLKKRKFSSVEITKEYLRRIKAYDREINSFITICEETAIESALEADKRIAKGAAGTLAGIPYANKDLLTTTDEAALDAEAVAIGDAIDGIADNVKFNGTQLVGGALANNGGAISIGINDAGDTATIGTATSLAIANTDQITGANGVDGSADTAMGQIAKSLGNVAAGMSALKGYQAVASASAANLKAAAARIQDTDYALETANLTKAAILNQSAMAMVAQANQAQQAILTVIQ